MDDVTTCSHLRQVVTARVAAMADYEDEFWAIADGCGVDRARAGHMLDIAVDWIGAGRAESADPYALALSWMPS
ncbi:hypothetical protein [Actinokineospora sp. NBRC 105648]|uniref:hypothetical protein n=1 Tax=Actinokineospora sp. NBRC 105648 TaxID=3032206 RepID=UPI0024A5CD14|nr:hypothetical protein [Actinokineospora sp. NBRC 105648]GLZ40163.1 hypothetical protein Acsp05_37870 [Actinokineospora sp. NBRC 105648]